MFITLNYDFILLRKKSQRTLYRLIVCHFQIWRNVVRDNLKYFYNFNSDFNSQINYKNIETDITTFINIHLSHFSDVGCKFKMYIPSSIWVWIGPHTVPCNCYYSGSTYFETNTYIIWHNLRVITFYIYTCITCSGVKGKQW